MEILRRLASPLQAPFPAHHSRSHDHHENNNQDHNLAFGTEWLEIEEPVGMFFPTMKKRRRLLQLDQVNYVLHYDDYKHVIRVQDISLISPVEEMNENGQFKWWMTIQDTQTLQLWVLHFPSLDRLAAWVETLQAIIKATKSTASISDIVVVSAGSTHGVHDMRISPTSNEKEMVLDMNPATIE